MADILLKMGGRSQFLLADAGWHGLDREQSEVCDSLK